MNPMVFTVFHRFVVSFPAVFVYNLEMDNA